MQQNLREIHLGEGLGNLRFGASREEVISQLGQPSDKEVYDLTDDPDFEDDRTEAWHYDDHNISVSFDEVNNWILSSIAVSSEDYTFEGQPLIGRKKDELLETLSKKGWGDIEEDEEVGSDKSGQSLVYVEGASLSLWFEDNILSEVQWGPFIKDNDVVWPSKNA